MTDEQKTDKYAIDNEDVSYGCRPGLCNYYEREKESEVNE